MTPQIPEYLSVFETSVRPVVTAVALSLIWMGAQRMEVSTRTRYITAAGLSAALILWLGVAERLGAANFYVAASESSLPPLLLGLLIPLIAAVTAVWFSRSVAILAKAIPLPWIVGAQLYRIGGGIFLVLLADGRLPWQFALPAGIGDVITGSFSVFLATRLAQGVPGARKAVFNWSLFGTADLIVALTMGALTSPGRAHLFALETPNLLIASYPLVMIPTFAVPLALMLHGLVFWRLRRETVSTGQLVAA